MASTLRARLKVDGVQEQLGRLDEIGDRARRTQPAMAASLLDLQRSEQRKFARGGWRKDTPDWIAEKRKRNLDPRTLRATGRLASALINANFGAGVLFRPLRNGLLWGVKPGASDIYYAQPLGKGYTRGGRQVPKRRMVVIDEEARMSISRRVETYIAHGIVR